MGAPARVPHGRRRPAARPARARPVRGAEPRLGPLPVPLLDRLVGQTATSSWRATTARRRRPSCSHATSTVARRRGVDLNPVDATTEHGARLLQAFVWADQTDRLERLRRAIEVLRADPPELIRGDYVDSLPALLADRRRRRAADRLPDRVDDVPLGGAARPAPRGARGGLPGRAARLPQLGCRTTTASRSSSSAIPAARSSGSRSSTSTAPGWSGAR